MPDEPNGSRPRPHSASASASAFSAGSVVNPPWRVARAQTPANSAESKARSPNTARHGLNRPRNALRATRAMPTAVRGPVDFSHGRHSWMRVACLARRASVQPCGPALICLIGALMSGACGSWGAWRLVLGSSFFKLSTRTEHTSIDVCRVCPGGGPDNCPGLSGLSGLSGCHGVFCYRQHGS